MCHVILEAESEETAVVQNPTRMTYNSKEAKVMAMLTPLSWYHLRMNDVKTPDGHSILNVIWTRKSTHSP